MLAGTICCQDGGKREFSYCKCEAHKRQCENSLSLLEHMEKKAKDRAGLTGLSPSSLTGCPTQTILSESEPFWESPAAYYNRWRGDMMHEGQTYSKEWKATEEKRVRYQMDLGDGPFQLHGKPDLLQANGILIDHKSTSRVPTTPYDDHEAQVNVYAYLLRMLGEDVREAWIHYLGIDREVYLPVPLWTEEAVESFIRRRSAPYVAYWKDGTMPPPLKGDQAWKAKYCAFKGTGKCCMERE